MPTKNHSKSLSAFERAKWWEVFVLPLSYYPPTTPEEIEARAFRADLAIEEYRKRITWRQP